MNKRVCRPIVHKDAHTAHLANELVAWFREAVFMPLIVALDEAKGVERENSTDALRAALLDNTVGYVQPTGQFIGKFSLAVTKELRALGAVYHASTQTFILPIGQIPYDLRAAIGDSVSRSKSVHATVLAVLAAILPNVGSSPQTIEADKVAALVLGELGTQFAETLPGIEAPQFSVEDRRRLTEELTENVTLAIKGFLEERIPELRRRVELNLAAGGNTVTLSTILEHEFGLAKNKAKFVAEQETALLISKYRQLRYESVGVTSYAWETKRDERVRPGHAALHGRTFSWDSPPIVDPATGRRCHPGEDYNCRCAPLPILVVPSEP